MTQRAGHFAFVLLVFGLVQCKTPTSETDSSTAKAVQGNLAVEVKASSIDDLPVMKGTDAAANAEVVLRSLQDVAPKNAAKYAKRIGHYLAFLGLDASSAAGKTALARLLNSSTQFILCEDFNDWACLEETPWITPYSEWRQDTEDDLGTMIPVDEPLKLDYYFTNQFDVDQDQADMSKMLALTLADKIRTQGKHSIEMALYGIDDIKGSMKPVYDAVIDRFKAGADVRAVMDTNGVSKKAPDQPLVLSFKKPSGTKPWAFDPVQLPMSVNTNLAMQYNGTVALMEALNQDAHSEDDYRARLEWPNRGIMHNKFMIFDKKSVWTGTSNVSATCMGTERNSNVGLFFDNKIIATAYETEFEEMYQYQPQPVNDAKLLNAQGKAGLKLGRFHKDKRPNTQRYFHFSDGVEVRLHFAPTDDGEHRVIIPMLLSAQANDVVRIAMFGTGGLELVRAIQYAASKGAKVELVLDCITGTGILRGKGGTILDPNPYPQHGDGEIVVRRSTWKKLNHHKTASLTRATPAGNKAVLAIVGSQNWSVTGNDVNDENMVTLRVTKGELALAKAFNDHFDHHLWQAASNGEMRPGVPYKDQGKCNTERDDADEDERGSED